MSRVPFFGPPQMRIVSLLPSATEIVCVLGVGDQLVGVSHECDYPPHVRQLPKVTQALIPQNASSAEIDALVRERLKTEHALFSLDRNMLEQLYPDLVVTQALCGVCAVAETEVSAAISRLGDRPRVVNLEPRRLSDVCDSMLQVGDAAGRSERARQVVAELQARVAAVAARSQSAATKPSVMLLEWIDPPFSSGHWTPELVQLAGGMELIGRAGEPSRRIRWDEILRSDPDVLVIACCGFDVERARRDLPLLAANPGFDKLRCVRSGRVYLLDGNAYFNRPGPRLVDGLEILAHALHPELHPLPAGLPLPECVEW